MGLFFQGFSPLGAFCPYPTFYVERWPSASAKIVDSGHPERIAKTDMGRYVLLLVNYAYIKGPLYPIIQLFGGQIGFLQIHSNTMAGLTNKVCNKGTH